MIEVTERINHLMDFYAPLLTEKQNQVLEYYFREDYSLSEIAELMEVSRSAVHDLLKRCEATLESYEEKLHLYEKFQNRLHLYEQIKQLGNEQIAELVEQCIITE
ncbi:MAG: putative DNA-binding protein [Erysipelotrichaceae bacterium]|nr:putative DNA-binding protein [Erysipelotrichaceae bacterium]